MNLPRPLAAAALLAVGLSGFAIARAVLVREHREGVRAARADAPRDQDDPGPSRAAAVAGRALAPPAQPAPVPAVRAARPSQDLFHELRADDPRTAGAFHEAVGLILIRMTDRITGSGESLRACLGSTYQDDSVRVRLDLDSHADQVVAHDARLMGSSPSDASRRCVESLFAGEVTVLARETNGPLPELTVAVVVPFPVDPPPDLESSLPPPAPN